jgi:hypothetical protein
MSTNNTPEVTIDGRRVEVSETLLEKYNQPGPRYTSYPTAPEWDDNFGAEDLRQAFREANAKPNPAPLSLYFHSVLRTPIGVARERRPWTL